MLNAFLKNPDIYLLKSYKTQRFKVQRLNKITKSAKNINLKTN